MFAGHWDGMVDTNWLAARFKAFISFSVLQAPGREPVRSLPWMLSFVRAVRAEYTSGSVPTKLLSFRRSVSRVSSISVVTGKVPVKLE
jgi:hypothetical protein